MLNKQQIGNLIFRDALNEHEPAPTEQPLTALVTQHRQIDRWKEKTQEMNPEVHTLYSTPSQRLAFFPSGPQIKQPSIPQVPYMATASRGYYWSRQPNILRGRATSIQPEEDLRLGVGVYRLLQTNVWEGKNPKSIISRLYDFWIWSFN